MRLRSQAAPDPLRDALPARRHRTMRQRGSSGAHTFSRSVTHREQILHGTLGIAECRAKRQHTLAPLKTHLNQLLDALFKLRVIWWSCRRAAQIESGNATDGAAASPARRTLRIPGDGLRRGAHKIGTRCRWRCHRLSPSLLRSRGRPERFSGPGRSRLRRDGRHWCRGRRARSHWRIHIRRRRRRRRSSCRGLRLRTRRINDGALDGRPAVRALNGARTLATMTTIKSVPSL